MPTLSQIIVNVCLLGVAVYYRNESPLLYFLREGFSLINANLLIFVYNGGILEKISFFVIWLLPRMIGKIVGNPESFGLELINWRSDKVKMLVGSTFGAFTLTLTFKMDLEDGNAIKALALFYGITCAFMDKEW